MNQPLSHHLLTMAYQNAWANHRLAKAWGQLSAVELAAPRVSFFPSIVATLNHILTCDWFYVDALERERRADDPHHDCYVFFKYDQDRKSTRLNSSHLGISYAVFCLKKK